MGVYKADTRLSPKQKRIFEKHLAAFASDSYDHVNPLAGRKMVAALSNEETYYPLWSYCYGAMSVTSTIIAEIRPEGEDVFLTEAGKRAIRTRMKEVLNKLGIR